MQTNIYVIGKLFKSWGAAVNTLNCLNHYETNNYEFNEKQNDIRHAIDKGHNQNDRQVYQKWPFHNNTMAGCIKDISKHVLDSKG